MAKNTGVIFTLDFKESDAAIEKAVMQATARALNLATFQAIKAIHPKLVDLLEKTIKGSPEYADIKVGHLRAELGIPNASEALDAIVEQLKRELFIKLTPYKPRGLEFVGGLEIGVVLADFFSILSLPTSSYISINSRGKSTPIFWLDWLLYEGNRVVVNNFHSVYRNSGFPTSRTGRTLMFQGGSWRVTPTSSTGVKNNNWITRALDYFTPIAESIVLDEVVKRL